MITHYHYSEDKSLSQLPHTSDRPGLIKLPTKNGNQKSLH